MAVPSDPAAQTAPAPPTPLTFPAAHYAKLAPSSFLAAHLSSSPPTRPSGRAPAEARPASINTGSLSHANGSAVVRLGDTAAVCGVRAEILLAGDVDGEHQRQPGLLVPNVELATGCNPAYLPGGPPSALAQSLAHRILTLLHVSDLVGMEELCVRAAPEEDEDEDDDGDEKEEGRKKKKRRGEVRAYWTLYVDTLFISLDGNAFDAAWLAVLAALRDVRLPRARWDVDRGTVMCSPVAAEASRLRLRGLPVPLTAAVFEAGKERRAWVLDDPDDFEEACCRDEGATVVVDDGGRTVLRVEMGGGGAVGVEGARALVQRAGTRWKEWRDVLGWERPVVAA